MFEDGDAQGLHALERLRTEQVGWLTSVTPNGQPQSFPVWFTCDGTQILVYNDVRAKRNRNLESNPRVSFHLNDVDGGDIVSIEGTIRYDPDAPEPGDNAEYMAKYGDLIDRHLGGPIKFGQRYSRPMRISVTRAVASPG
jgi:PPOX class probable F420-dependent enzyme